MLRSKIFTNLLTSDNPVYASDVTTLGNSDIILIK